jgi:hypothetical protein
MISIFYCLFKLAGNGSGMNSCRTGNDSASYFGFLIFLQYLNNLRFRAIIYAGMLGTGG